MERDYPFLAHRVKYALVTPSIEVEFIEKDEEDREFLRHSSPEEFYKKFPLATKTFSLEDLIKSGQHIKAVNPAIYESNDSTDRPFTDSDLLEAAKEVREQLDLEKPVDNNYPVDNNN